MQIAFYAPMKSPRSPVPSGDREMARRLMSALETSGHDVRMPCRFVSRDGDGDRATQRRLAEQGERIAARLVRRLGSAAAVPRPDLWFTYHLYHKAPDHLGPAVSRALGIPYVVAEASHAPKQAGGRWDAGFRAAERAIRAADAVIGLSSLDAACVVPLLAAPGRYHRLRPFTDTRPYRAAAADRAAHRDGMRSAFAVPDAACLLLAVGMMRPGAKLASYRTLAAALGGLDDASWTLLIVGDGPARADVEACFRRFAPGRVAFAGAQPPDALPAFYAAADLFVWPAIDEAYGMALLEAQASGLAAVAGRAGGVADIVRDGVTGVLTDAGDAAAFGAAVARLIGDAPARHGMGAAAARIVAAENGLEGTAEALDRILRSLPGSAAAA